MEADSQPYVNLKYYWPYHECLSEWSADKLKAFGEFCRKLRQSTWPSIYKTGGQPGVKTGLGYTKHNDPGVLPDHPDLGKISPELTWFELRIDHESRVHGFRVKDAFFLVFLDKDHKIYRSK